MTPPYKEKRTQNNKLKFAKLAHAIVLTVCLKDNAVNTSVFPFYINNIWHKRRKTILNWAASA
jgi:hypothetical protein